MSSFTLRGLDKKIAFLSKFQPNDAPPAYVEAHGPPTAWKIYKTVGGPLDEFQFKRMTPENRDAAIWMYLQPVLQYELRHLRAQQAAQQLEQQALARERVRLVDFDDRLGAW